MRTPPPAATLPEPPAARRHRRPLPLLLAVLVVGTVAGAGVVRAQSAAPPRTAVLARADDPVDALSASAVAAQLGGVVLLTAPDVLSDDTRAGLEAFGPELVVLAGGTQALTPAVEDQVAALGVPVRRVAGSSRLETSRALAALPAELGVAFLGAGGTAADSERLAGLTLGQVEDLVDSRRSVTRRAVPEEPVDLSGAGTYLVTEELEAPEAGVITVRCSASVFANGEGFATGGLVVVVDGTPTEAATLTLTPQQLNEGTDGASVTDTAAVPVEAGTHAVGCFAGQGAGDVDLFAGSAVLEADFAAADRARVGTGDQPAPTPSATPDATPDATVAARAAAGLVPPGRLDAIVSAAAGKAR